MIAIAVGAVMLAFSLFLAYVADRRIRAWKAWADEFMAMIDDAVDGADVPALRAFRHRGQELMARAGRPDVINGIALRGDWVVSNKQLPFTGGPADGEAYIPWDRPAPRLLYLYRDDAGGLRFLLPDDNGNVHVDAHTYERAGSRYEYRGLEADR